MKRYWITISAVLTLLTGCHSTSEQGVTINGEISGLEAGEMISCVRPAASPDSMTEETVTTTAGPGGKFTLHIPVKSGRADWYRIWFGATPQPDKMTTLYLDAGEIRITGRDGKLADAALSGNNDMMEYNGFLSGFKTAVSAAVNEPALGLTTGNPLGDYIGHWIAAHPSSALGTALLEQYRRGPLPVDTVIAAFSRRSPESLNNLPGQRLKDWLKTTSDVMLNKTAPDFTMSDTAGKQISLKDFRGKYVLLDFWASWCGPCRAENPNVVQAYGMYKDKGFTVLGVSLDMAGASEAWLDAIHKDGLHWSHVSDLKYFDNAAAKLYHIESIPSNWLIDPQGVIIARNLRGQALEDKLAAVLKL